jgi:transposase
LQARARSRTLRHEDVRRAKLILLLAAGKTYATIVQELGCGQGYVTRWRRRFDAQRLAGLYARHKGRKVQRITPQMQARILRLVSQSPTDGSTHWSTRKLAAVLGISHMSVARVLSRADVRPHVLERYMASPDPEFEAKAAECIGLYLNPPQHAAVFCVDEKTSMQALDRRDPRLPLSPGRAERHGFEYYRHGTLSLYAALNTATGAVIGKTADRHTSAEFVAFLADLVATQPKAKHIHIIADNLSAHKTQRVRDFLSSHPNVQLHYTPTYSSWLNQVEIWFSKLARDMLHRGIFTSVQDLARKLMKFIRHYNQTARPFKWKYHDVQRRITPALTSSVTGH